MTDLEHLQKVILIIVKDIDILCRKHQIKYFLLGGSAIGAVRHKGFIPWDDDIDVIVPRKDWNRFIEAMKKSNMPFRDLYKLISIS